MDEKEAPLIDNHTHRQYDNVENHLIVKEFYYNYLFFSILIAINHSAIMTCLYYSNMQLSNTLGISISILMIRFRSC